MVGGAKRPDHVSKRRQELVGVIEIAKRRQPAFEPAAETVDELIPVRRERGALARQIQTLETISIGILSARAVVDRPSTRATGEALGAV